MTATLEDACSFEKEISGEESERKERINLEKRHSQLESCSIYNSLPDDFKEAVEKNIHLLVYLHQVVKDLGLPTYAVQLSREMRDMKRINIIYPVGDPIFIHIFTVEEGERGKYHPVEPQLPQEKKNILEEVEEEMALLIDESYDYETPEEQIKLLDKLLNQVLLVDDGEDGKTRVKDAKIKVTREIYETVRYQLVKEKVGAGLLEPLLRDPYIEDISCDGPGPIFVEHKIFKSLETTIGFGDDDELNDFIIRMTERVGRPVSFRKPIVDAALPDGSRLNVVFGRDLSRRGTNFTIRKFSEVPISITQLIKWNTLDAMEAAYLWMLLYEGMSVWVSGETASGKTTTLKAITTFIEPTAKVVTIEDTPEIVLPHPNWISEVTREGEGGADIDMFSLLKAALRQRPNYILVGEIRGKEGNIAFQAMQTGHPVMATFHASSMEKLIQRVTGYPIEVPKTYIDNLNAVIIQSAVRNPVTGRVDRRVLSINEIVGYDPIEQRFDFIELFSWDPSTDTHIFRGEGNSYLLEFKIAPKRGLSRRNMHKIYKELKVRARILQKLTDLGILNYYDVWDSIKKISQIGLERALARLERGRL